MIVTKKKRIVFFYVTFVILMILSFYFVLPFVKSVLAAMMLAFICNPFYKKLKEKTGKERLSALIVTIMVLLIIIIPLVYAIKELVTESTVTFVVLKQKLISPQRACDDSKMCVLMSGFQDLIKDPKIKFYLTDSLEKFLAFVTTEISTMVVALPKMVLNIFIMFVSLFYFMKDGPIIISRIQAILPIKKENLAHLFERFVSISKAIMFGYMVTAFIQGGVALIGFYMVNLFFAPHGTALISAPLLWAIILSLFSMIPVIGSGFVWAPLSAVLILEGYLDGNSSTLFGGIFLFFYGLIFVSNIDNVVRPLLSGRRAKVHPLVVFLGIFGGLVTFGIVGIFVGPLIFALLLSYIKFYEEDNI